MKEEKPKMLPPVRKMARYDRVLGRSLVCAEAVPGVIDVQMIREEAVKTSNRGLVGETFNAFYKIEAIEKIHLERLMILRIDNLWMLKRIAVLSLSNNIIEKIENLDCLPTLVELNLSFNKIKHIENLESLDKLERLSLYHNCIRHVTGLDSLPRLTILSLGANQIENWDCIKYLRQIQSLKSLNLEGNPCCTEGLREYAAAFLPQLEYFGYSLVVASERIKGKQHHQEEYLELIKVEKAAKEEENRRKAIEERKRVLSESYVENLEGEEMYEALFATDPDGINLQLLGDKVSDIYATFRTEINNLSKELFKFGQKEYKRRSEEHKEFLNVLKQVKETGQEQSRSVIKEFEEVQVVFMNSLVQLTNNFHKKKDKGPRIVKLSRLNEAYLEHYEKYWLALMGREVFLHDQVEDLLGQLEQRMGEHVSEFVEKGRQFFTNMRDAEMNYFESLSDKVFKYLSVLIAKETDLYLLPPELALILRDKDSVNNAVGTSHDQHLLVIDKTEDTLIKSITTWFKDLLLQYAQEEIKRNRICVLELINYLEDQKETFIKQYKSSFLSCRETYNQLKESLKAKIQTFGGRATGLDELRKSSLTIGVGGEKKVDVSALLKDERKRPKKRVMIMLPEEKEDVKEEEITWLEDELLEEDQPPPEEQPVMVDDLGLLESDVAPDQVEPAPTETVIPQLEVEVVTEVIEGGETAEEPGTEEPQEVEEPAADDPVVQATSPEETEEEPQE